MIEMKEKVKPKQRTEKELLLEVLAIVNSEIRLCELSAHNKIIKKRFLQEQIMQIEDKEK